MERNEAAEGVLTIINSNMANAIRSRTVQKGTDPRGYALVAFGGAGPLHGADVAALLDIPEVLVPPHPGITSATGLLTTDLKYDHVRTSFQVSGSVDLERLNADYAEMEASLRAQLDTDGVPPSRTQLQRSADCRYVGQGYELRINLPPGVIDDDGLAAGFAQFEDIHRTEYGHVFPDSPIEIVNLRLTGTGEMPKLGSTQVAAGDSIDAAHLRDGTGVFRTADGLQAFDMAFYQRDLLPVDVVVDGPAIVVQKDSTTVVRPQDTFRKDAAGNLVIAIGANA